MLESVQNEYLAWYQRELRHQIDHGSPLLSSIYGAQQPWDTCMQCRTERNPPRHEFGGRPNAVKAHYSWAVPDEQALRAIAERSPRGVVEIGAGGGYWMMLLRAMGVDVIAYDPHEPSEDNGFATHKWAEVLLGDHTSVIGHPDRTLLLCWPSYAEPWGADTVDLYEGDTVIYIGELGGCTGDDRMHALLGETPYCWDKPCTCQWPAAKFKEVDTVSIPQWQELHDALRVYERTS